MGVVEGGVVVTGRNVVAGGVGLNKELGMTAVVWKGVLVITACSKCHGHVRTKFVHISP